jgi:hypothetical protein
MLAVLPLLLPSSPAALEQQLQRNVADRPAATLLLPYFEVDPANPSGVTTQLAIGNAGAAAALARVTLWSDLAVPVFAFDVYLTGYDLQRIDLRDVLSGVLPQTADAGQDPQDTVSPGGGSSQDATFPGCAGRLPPPPLAAADVAALRAALTGGPSALHGGLCCGRSLGDGHARGFVTVDSVSQCSQAFPGSAGYFVSGGLGIADNRNILWGDYALIDRAKQTARAVGGSLVHVRADALDPLTSLPGSYTFYGRLIGFSGADNRLPLATSFAARYISPQTSGETVIEPTTGLPFTTYVMVWRDPKVAQGPFPCGTVPGWFPLEQTQVGAFDEQERIRNLTSTPSVVFPVQPDPPTPFPAATQVVEVNGPELPADFNSGWLFLNLSTTVAGAAVNPTAQAWVEVLHDGGGLLSVGYRALQLDNAATSQPGPGPLIFLP